jgi:hypothetical protein
MLYLCEQRIFNCKVRRRRRSTEDSPADSALSACSASSCQSDAGCDSSAFDAAASSVCGSKRRKSVATEESNSCCTLLQPECSNGDAGSMTDVSDERH